MVFPSSDACVLSRFFVILDLYTVGVIMASFRGSLVILSDTLSIVTSELLMTSSGVGVSNFLDVTLTVTDLYL